MYLRLLGEELGPLSWAELEELVRRGTLGGDDAVRREEESLWVPARHFSELRSLLAAPSDSAVAPAAPADGSGGTQHASAGAGRNAEADCAGSGSARQSWRRMLLAAVGLAPMIMLAAAGVGWYWHRQSLRYPLPARLRQQAARSGRYLLGFGPLSNWEYAIVLFDLVLVAGACGYFAWRRWRSLRPGARQRA